MEIFVEQNVVPEMRIAVQLVVVGQHWPAATLVSQEDARQPPRQFVGDLADGEEPAAIQWGTRP